MNSFSTTSAYRPQPWYTRSDGQARLAEEMRRLRPQAQPNGVTVSELPGGDVVFTVVTPDPPGYTLYLQTAPNYPMTAPRITAERRGQPQDSPSRTIATWQPGNYLSQVVDDVVVGVTRRRLFIAGGIGAFLLVLISVVSAIVLIAGTKRIDDAAAAMIELRTNAAQASIAAQSLLTAQVQQTAYVSAHPNETITAPPALSTAVAAATQAANELNRSQAQATQAAFSTQTANAVRGTQTASAGGTQTAAAIPTATPPPTATPTPLPTATPVFIAPLPTQPPYVAPTNTPRSIPTVTRVPTVAPTATPMPTAAPTTIPTVAVTATTVVPTVRIVTVPVTTAPATAVPVTTAPITIAAATTLPIITVPVLLTTTAIPTVPIVLPPTATIAPANTPTTGILVTLPWMIGHNKDAATQELKALGLVVSLIPATQTQNCSAPNSVCSQSPSGNTSVPKGSAVVLTYVIP